MVIRNRKMVRKHRWYLLIFPLELEIFGVAAQRIHQNSIFCEELRSEIGFETILVNFCCYDYGANASEAVQKISTRTLLELCQLTIKQLILKLHL